MARKKKANEDSNAQENEDTVTIEVTSEEGQTSDTVSVENTIEENQVTDTVSVEDLDEDNKDVNPILEEATVDDTVVIETPVIETTVSTVVIEDPIVEVVKASPYPSIDESFHSYLTNLKTLNYATAIKYLSSMFHNLAMKGDEKQLDYVLNLMRSNKEYVLDFYKAMNSIQMINKSTKTKVEIMFVIFNKIINNTPNQINYDVIRKETGNEKLIIWMNRRIKK